jgi:hypothetical protein
LTHAQNTRTASDEHYLPVTEEREICKLIGILEEFFHGIANCDSSIDIEHHAKERHRQHHKVENIPETLQVLQAMFSDLQNKTWEHNTH